MICELGPVSIVIIVSTATAISKKSVSPGVTVAAITSQQAATLGVSPEERLYDLMCEDGGRAMLLLPVLNFSRGNHDAIHEMMEHPDTLLGLADGGAHCGVI